jgi:hypothetical protein
MHIYIYICICTHTHTHTHTSTHTHTQGDIMLGSPFEKMREAERQTDRDMSRHQGCAQAQLAPIWRTGTRTQTKTHTHVSWRKDRQRNTVVRARAWHGTRVRCEEIELLALVLCHLFLLLFRVGCLVRLALLVDRCSSFTRWSAPPVHDADALVG